MCRWILTSGAGPVLRIHRCSVECPVQTRIATLTHVPGETLKKLWTQTKIKLALCKFLKKDLFTKISLRNLHISMQSSKQPRISYKRRELRFDFLHSFFLRRPSTHRSLQRFLSPLEFRSQLAESESGVQHVETLVVPAFNVGCLRIPTSKTWSTFACSIWIQPSIQWHPSSWSWSWCPGFWCRWFMD